MTSSYNISRRSPKELYSPTAWEVHQKQFGVCPPNHITIPIKQNGSQCSDWKFCVPVLNEDGMPSSYPTYKNIARKDVNVNCRRHYTSDLYLHPNHTDQSPMNMYPPRSRRPERRELDEKDYFRLPGKYDGTGYHPVRSWAYPEYVLDYVDVPDEWNQFELIQRSEQQKLARDEAKKREKLGLKPYEHLYLGTFYD